MVVYSNLHLADNLQSLDLLAQRNSLELKKLKFEQICNLMDKLYKESQQSLLDQEKSYILFSRYVSLYKTLYNVAADPKFIKLRFGSEYEKICAQLEQTKNNLRERYEFKEEPVDDNSEGASIAVAKEDRPPIFDCADLGIFVSPTLKLTVSAEFISCQLLISALSDSSNSLLILDARPEVDFLKSRFAGKTCINVPNQVINSGLSANMLGKRLTGDAQRVWDRRDSFDAIVMFDWDTTIENFALTKLIKLRAALVDWDFNRTYNERPVILNGGYLELLQTYPTMCINPHVYLCQKNTELDELLDIDSIEYPTESDSKSHVMGSGKSVGSGPSDIGDLESLMDDDFLSPRVSTESLIKEKKELVINEQGVISKLMESEDEWKKIYEMCSLEKDNDSLTKLKQKEKEVQDEIQRLERALDELNEQKELVSEKIDLRAKMDPENEVLKSEEAKTITQIEEDDEKKLKILDTIAEERCRALQQARASKRRSDESPSKYESASPTSDKRLETDRPTINRATKPRPFSRIPPELSSSLSHCTSGLVGLRNIRNTCYMNTLLQCLRNVPPVTRLFLTGNFAKYDIRSPAAIIYETASLFRILWSKNIRYYDPIEFYTKVCSLEPNYQLGHHEDCMEFYLFILNHLSDDCSYESQIPPVMTPKQKAWYNQFQGRNSVFIDLFYHQVRVTQTCLGCGQKTIKFEIENSLMLCVPNHDFTLSELIADYMNDYVIKDYCCSKCKQPVMNKKEFSYEPKVMALVLKRYRQSNAGGANDIAKVEIKCNFEKTALRIGSCSYQLNAIVMHSGSVHYGHYTAACLTPKGWFEFNDELIRPININGDSVKHKACAFFYTMCDELN